MTQWHRIEGAITAPKGFQAVGISAGLKKSQAPDLALIYSETEAIVGGVFTTSQVRAACVDYCRQRLQKNKSARAILCNAGQANAGTGAQGWQDAVTCANGIAELLNISPNEVFLASTGVIGQRIKMDAMLSALPDLVAQLSAEGGESAARAIVTTDLVPKSIALETMIDDRPVRIGGIAKGSGMIHPNMATMLGFITCDAMVSTQLWQEMLKRAVDASFNQITVDGDTSTNDTVIALANGQSRTPAITTMDDNGHKLQGMLTAVCQFLAKAIARDGEGATCLIEVQVTGAVDNASANKIAKTIAGSSLVKSAVFGRDPNWGRIAAAAGRAGVKFNQDDLRIQLGDILLMEFGQPLPFDRQSASDYLLQASQGEYLKSDTVLISVAVGEGAGVGGAWGCDLTYDYIKINAEYTT